MRFNDIYQHTHRSPYVDIKVNCSSFINESAGLPVYKALPESYGDVHRCKVRQRKKVGGQELQQTFEQAFNKPKLRQRAVFTVSNRPETIEEDQDVFYVFPTNGYQYAYSTEIQNSEDEYKDTFNALLERIDRQQALNIITELLKYSYNTTNLREGLVQGSEIIFYDIPCFYAVRASSVSSYHDLLTQINQ